ncbi:MAG TPA: alpha/beta fold hydrolase [Candidatus Cybelea sp.]|nr:alpha/beta fold hydrolase [Candidatus Cybelea sp.]
MIIELDRLKLYAATGGQPLRRDRPLALFLHGAGMDHSVWTLAARYLAHHECCVLAVDLPGHGRSEGPALESIAAMADWAWRLLGHLELERAALIGHSMGALVSVEMARTAPGRAAKIMLVGFAPRMPVHQELLDAARFHDPKAAALIADWGFGAAGHLGGNRAPGVAMQPLGLRLIERAPAGTLYADLAACNAYRDAEGAAIHCPVLLLQGEADRMTSAKAAAAFVEKLAHGEIRILPDVGHMVMSEAPLAVTAALREFILTP